MEFLKQIIKWPDQKFAYSNYITASFVLDGDIQFWLWM